MKIGDLVICHCLGNTWYKGLAGIIAEFTSVGPPGNEGLGEVLVLYGGNREVELMRLSLKVIS